MIKITPLDEWIHKKINGEGSCLGKADLEAYQLDKLNWTLSYVRKHSPFYRQHLAGLPDQIHALAELNQFPLSGADDLRREPLAFVCVPQDQIHRIVTLQTSGTTGHPKRVFFTAEDQDLTIDFFGVGMSVLTEPDERVLILLPGERPGSVGELLSRGLTRAGKVPVAHGPVVDPLLTLERMEQAGIDCLVGAPVQVLSLAEHWQPGKRKPRTVLLSTDYVPNAIVHRIEETWGCEVFNHYGTTEMGLGGGVECSAHRGYHLREADLYFELIDPKSGFPAAKGEDGEVVITTLTRQGMPLFRYRMDDLSRFLPEYCPCGTSLRTLEKARGRISQFIELREGLLRIPDLDEQLFSLPGVLNYTASLSGDDRIPVLQIDLQLHDEANQVCAAQEALREMPVMRNVSIQITSRLTSGMTGSLVKRTILDLRSR